jgi:hypothetical protein
MHSLTRSSFISQYEHAKPAQVRIHLLEEHKHWKVPERRVAKFVKRQKRAPGTAVDDESAAMSTMSTASSVSRVSQRAKSMAKGVGRILHIGGRSKNKGGEESAPPVSSLLGEMSPSDDGVSEVHEDDPLDPMFFSSPVLTPTPMKDIKQALSPKEEIKEAQPDDSEAPTEFVTALESVEEAAEAEVKGRSLSFADENDDLADAEVKGLALAFADVDDGLAFTDENDGKKEGGLCQPCEGCNIL